MPTHREPDADTVMTRDPDTGERVEWRRIVPNVWSRQDGHIAVANWQSIADQFAADVEAQLDERYAQKDALMQRYPAVTPAELAGWREEMWAVARDIRGLHQELTDDLDRRSIAIDDQTVAVRVEETAVSVSELGPHDWFLDNSAQLHEGIDGQTPDEPVYRLTEVNPRGTVGEIDDAALSRVQWALADRWDAAQQAALGDVVQGYGIDDYDQYEYGQDLEP